MVVGLMIGTISISAVGCTDEPRSERPGDAANLSEATTTSVPTATPTLTAIPPPSPTGTPTPPPTPSPTPSNTPIPLAIPSPTAVPTPKPITDLSPAEVYERVSPSVAFIETPAATGSGVLIRDGYVVTNYHVVWPHDSVRVVFPDGTEFDGVPVVGWDPMADLAVLSPVDVPAQPLILEDGEDAAIGSELFLVGYPAEADRLLNPSITRGILSRFREWERPRMTYFQTDAAVGGGQSGGALVNARGQVVGISTFSFSDAGFALASSSTDVMSIVEELIQRGFTSELGDRRLQVGGRGSFEFELDLRNFWDTRSFVLEATAGTLLEVEIAGPPYGLVGVSDTSGANLEVDEGQTGTGSEYGKVVLPSSGVHILQVGMAFQEPSGWELSSNIRLRPLNDPDDGRTVTVGETVAGSLDHHTDRDWYSINLNEGETVRIYTDSLNVDTLIYVDFPNSRYSQIVSDDDSGGGLFGLNSELVYRAPHSGEYIIAVTDATDTAHGGYYLSVELARQGTKTVVVPPTATPVPTAVPAATAIPNPTRSTWPRLEAIRDRGRVICAGRNDIPGWGYFDHTGNNVGFDIDLCRAVAAAVLGDPNAIEVRLITAAERGPVIQSGEVDMMVRTVTWTNSRDAIWGNYVQTMFYDGQGFMARKELRVSSALDLKEATVCVTQGTTTELNLLEFSIQNDLNITIVTFEDTEAVLAAYEARQCDAFTNDHSQLAALGTVLQDRADHVILPETISEEPLGPVVPHGDDQWFDIVKTVMGILIYAEAYGITADGIPETPTGSDRVDRLLGFQASFGQEALGLSHAVARDVIRAVGNYGEIYERHLGAEGLGLIRENSRNALWEGAPCTYCPKGGQIYAAPLR